MAACCRLWLLALHHSLLRCRYPLQAQQQVFIYFHDGIDNPGFNYTITLAFTRAQPPPPSPPPSPSPPSSSAILSLALSRGNLGDATSITASASTAGLPDLGQLVSPDGIFCYTTAAC